MLRTNGRQRRRFARTWHEWPARLLVLSLLACGLGSLFLLTTQLVLLALSTEAVAEALANLVGNIPIVGNALSAIAGDLGLAAWLEKNLFASAFLIGLLIGLASFWKLSRRMAMGLFAPLDASVALQITPPKAALEPLRPGLEEAATERPLPWVEPVVGPRFDVWQKLYNFAFGPGEKFEYQLLLGGPGSGKTRMSIEFARRILGKRGATDDGMYILHGLGNIDRQLTKIDRFKSWWRVRVLAQEPVPSDIWHIGWFSPEAVSRSGGRITINGQLATNLDRWRPTCPTFLLLDDPIHHDSALVVETLSKNSMSFRHRVRLLITNQTVPGDLRVTRVGSSHTWQSQLKEAFGAPLALSATTPLLDAEIRLLSAHLPPRLARPILSDAGLGEFRDITRGNPLLVELGLAWLMAGKPLTQMTEEALLEERSRRFLEAIKAAGFDGGQGQLVDLLVMATIANGAPTTMPDGKETIWGIFGVQRIAREHFARLFPTEVDVDLRTFLPPLRPQTMAIAFSRAAMFELEPIDCNRIIRTAWRANPQGTLRTMLRIDGGYKFRTDRPDPLQSAFNAVPIEVALPPFDLFCLLAQASCTASPDDWADGNFLLGAGLLEKALEQIGRLAPDELPSALAFIVDLILGGRKVRLLREASMARVLMELVRALDIEGRLFDLPVLNDLARWASSPRARGHDCLDDWQFGNSSREVTAIKVGTTSFLLEYGMTAFNREARILFWRLIAKAAQHEEAIAHASILRDGATFIVDIETTAIKKDFARWEGLRTQFPHILSRAKQSPRLELSIRSFFADTASTLFSDAVQVLLPLSQDFSTKLESSFESESGLLLVARFWRSLVDAYAHRLETDKCLRMAERVELLSLRAPDNEQIQAERTRSWLSVSKSSKTDTSLKSAVADRIDKIALKFPDNEEIQEVRAAAWILSMLSALSDTAFCGEIVERVEAIAKNFDDRDSLQNRRVEALRYAAYSNRFDPIPCRRLAGRVETIALRFLDHEPIQEERATAWRMVAYANQSDQNQCRIMAERVDSIARRFPEHLRIQEECATAWRMASTAARGDPIACWRYADRVEVVAAQFAGIERFQEERANAWSNVAFASRFNLIRCREAADRVETIAQRFPKNTDIQNDCAIAWCAAAHSAMSDPTVCAEMAERVEAIGRRFPQHEEIQASRARAWFVAAMAAALDTEVCRKMVEKVASIARKFPSNREINDHARSSASLLARPSA